MKNQIRRKKELPEKGSVKVQISIPARQAKWLQLRNRSPSALLQEKIDELIEDEHLLKIAKEVRRRKTEE